MCVCWFYYTSWNMKHTEGGGDIWFDLIWLMHGYCLSCIPHCGSGRSPGCPALSYKAGYCVECRWQWPCGQRRRSETAWLLESRFWIPLRAWNVCLLCLLCDLSLPGVPVCMWSRNLNTRRPRPELGFYAKEKNIILINDKQIKKNVEESGRGLF